jgi:DUF438 domain-containing protein
MMEDFINVAIDAFAKSGGYIDKFETYLRENLVLVENENLLDNQVSLNDEMDDSYYALVDFELSNQMIDELSNLDYENLSEEQILAYAKKYGFIK